ncbi:hypothetical protein [Fusobacterium polymorphum]|uniref:hypothetical protein n=1 Tax=Fusobacterium nucleatum subsp. polymorphum TaxID=76857 RepID=UPI00300855E2
MIKRMIILTVIGLIFSSCQEIAIIKYSIDDAIQQAEIRKITSPYYGKDGAWSYQTNKEVFNVVKEVLKRPINKEIQFDGIKIMIPEDTRINSRKGAIVDIKTGYGLPICIYTKDYCDTYSDARSKKRLAGGYYYICYFSENKDTKALFEKISKANGFEDTCK